MPFMLVVNLLRAEFSALFYVFQKQRKTKKNYTYYVQETILIY